MWQPGARARSAWGPLGVAKIMAARLQGRSAPTMPLWEKHESCCCGMQGTATESVIRFLRNARTMQRLPVHGIALGQPAAIIRLPAKVLCALPNGAARNVAIRRSQALWKM